MYPVSLSDNKEVAEHYMGQENVQDGGQHDPNNASGDENDVVVG